MKVLVLSGPNLNLLGQREPDIYGSETLEDIEYFIKKSFEEEAVTSNWRQSNSESELIEWIQTSGKEGFDAIVINPAGLTHSSVSLHDALKFFDGIKLEVHISNTYKREDFRKIKITSGASDGVIEGLGKYGYKLAFQYIIDKNR